MWRPDLNLAFLTSILLLSVSIMPGISALSGDNERTDLTLSFNIPEPQIVIEDGHSLISIHGWGTSSVSGDTVLPERTYYIPIGKGDEPRYVSHEAFGSGSMDLSYGPLIVPYPGTMDHINYWTEYQKMDMVNILGTIDVHGSMFLMIRLSPFSYDDGLLEYPSRIDVEFILSVNPMMSHVDVPEDLSDPTVSVDVDDTPLWEFPIRSSAIPSPGATYYNTVPDTQCLIVTSSTLNSTLQDLADWKTQRGVYTRVVETSWIYNNFAGTDNQERIRNCIKTFYTNEDLKWVILGGDHSVVPTRLAYIPDGYGDTGSDGSSAPADGYYGDLTGTGATPYDWDGDNDGNFGEYSVDGIDLAMEVYVGRLSATSTNAMGVLVTNILNYEKSPPSGGWYNRSVLAGAFSNYDTSTSTNNTTDEAKLKEAIRTDYLSGGNYNTYTLYERSGINPSTFTSNTSLTTSNLISAIDTGAFMVNLAGHGSSTGIYRRIWSADSNSNGICDSGEYYDTAYYSTSASQSNGGMKPFFYNDACNNGDFDRTWCISEDILRDVGIGAVGAGRVSWYAVGWTKGTDGGWYNQGHDYRFWEQFFAGNYQPGKALALSHSDYISDKGAHDRQVWKNLLQYNLLGDPEVSVWTQTPGQFNVTYSDPIPTPGNYQFTVKDGSDNPVQGAVVTLMDGSSFYGTATTDALGNATISMPQLTSSMTLTVAGHNFKPFIRTVTAGYDTTPPTIGTPVLAGNWSTGDDFNIKTRVTDDVEVKDVRIDYGWGSVQPTVTTNISMLIAGLDHIFDGTHSWNSTDPFWYSISANDSKGNWANTSWSSVSVVDNDRPFLINENSSLECTTGDPFTFSSRIDDNIKEDLCYVNYSYGGSSWTRTLMNGTGADRYHSINIPSDQIGTLYYRFNFTDTAGNLNVSTTYSRTVVDNDAPSVLSRSVDLPPTTGDFTWFYVKPHDNIGLNSVRLVYYIEGQSSGNQSMHYDGGGNYSEVLHFDNGMLSNVTYQFYLADTSGNRYISPPAHTRVVDDEAAELYQYFLPSFLTTGDEQLIQIDARDNIGVSSVSAYIQYPGSMDLNTTLSWNFMNYLYETTITAPSSVVGNVTVKFIINDTSGNLMVSGQFPMILVDNDTPNLVADQSDTQGVCGETLRYQVLVEDNIEVNEVRLFRHQYVEYEVMIKDTRSDTYYIDTIAYDSIEAITYHFEIEDIFGNVLESENSRINISDETEPEAISIGFLPADNMEADMVANLTTGETFTLVTVITDNEALDEMWAEFKIPGNDTILIMDLSGEKMYEAGFGPFNFSADIEMPSDVVGIIKYRINAVDRSGNEKTGPWISVYLIDNDSPAFDIMIPETYDIETESEVSFEFLAWDNIEILSWKASIEIFPEWVVTISRVDERFIVDVITDETYRDAEATLVFTASDGNRSVSASISGLVLLDRTTPVISVMGNSLEMMMSTTYDLSFGITDNNRWTDADITWFNEWTGEEIIVPSIIDVKGISASIIPPRRGTWILNISANDVDQNSGWKLIRVTISDDIEPVVVISDQDGEVQIGGSIVLDGEDSTDNSNIESFTWTVICPDGTEETYEGSLLEFDPEIEGVYNITLEIVDEFGNLGVETTSITVTPFTEDEDLDGGESDWILPAVIIGSVLLLLIVMLSIFLVMRKRKEDTEEDDEETMSWD